MITRVRLKNWKSHLDTELTFSSGVNCLIGNMGSGKTSVMQGISFALFGTFPSLQSRRLVLNDMIMSKPRKQGRAEVELDFVIDGVKYFIRRTVERGRGTTDAEIRKGGRIIDVNSTNVTKIVEDVLQIDYELFSRAVYSEQDGLDYFLRIPKGRRMEHIDGMLKVDRFGLVRDSATTLRNRFRHGIEEKTKIVADLEKEGFEERMEKVSAEIREFKGRLSSLEKELKEIRKGKDDIQEQLNAFEERERDANRLRQSLEGLMARSRHIEEDLERKRKYVSSKNQHGIEKDLGELKTRLEKLKEEIEELEKRLYDLEARKKLLAETSDRLEEFGDKCPFCDSPLTHDKKSHLLSERKRELEIIRNGISAANDDLELKKREAHEKEKELRLIELESERMRNYLEEISELEEKQYEVVAAVSTVRGREEELSAELEKFPLKELRKSLQEKSAEEGRRSSEFESIRDRIEDKQAILDELKHKSSLLEKYRKEIWRSEKILNDMGNFVKALELTQGQLREEFLKTVNSIMNRIWAELYPYGDFTEVRLAIDKDYVLQLKDSTGWISVEGIASGGERSMAALALRIAFSLAFIPNLRWLILDEPTHNMDSNAVRHFTEILREKMGTFAEQVFLITHEEAISNGITGSLYRLERKKEADEPTQVVGD